MPDIFLSYSREDLARARHFAHGFEREGFTVWWDQALDTGEAFDRVTEKALEEAKAVVVLWSRHSVDSRWVRAEATQADEHRKLVPVTIEPCKRPIMFHLTQTADLTHWNGDPDDKAWQALVAGLRRQLGKSPGTAPIPTTASASHHTRNLVIAIVALLLAGPLAFILGRGIGKPVTRPVTAGAVQAAPVTLAVLPFENLSSDPEQEYFSDGLTEEILNQLAQIKALRVVARTSSFSFKGKNEDLRVVGQKLGVSHLLEGSVRKNGEQLRITAQLINAADGSHLWSQTYARKMDDVFAVQEEIAKDVAKALSITLDVGELRRAEGGTTNVAAYEKYLQARAVSLNSEGPAADEQVAQLSREAVALDPGFSLAWGMLRDALDSLAFFDAERAPQLQMEAANARAHAVALTPDAPWVKTMIAAELVGQRKWMDAESALREAGKSAPASGQDPDGLPEWYLFQVGRVADALRANDLALKREPLSLVPSMQRQILLDASGRADEAQAEYQRSLAFAGGNIRLRYLALLRVMRQKDADPGAVQARIRELNDIAATAQPDGDPIFFGLVAKAGNPQAMLAVLRKALDGPDGQDNLNLVVISDLADAFGDRDLALQAMRRNFVDLRFVEAELAWQPFKTGLRADPRFKQIVRDMGLVDYWRKAGNWGDFCEPVGKEDFQCH